MARESVEPSSIAARASIIPASMGQLQDLIDYHRNVLTQHPFLQRLEGAGQPSQMRCMVSLMTFFTLAFQDVLRLARTACMDCALRNLAQSLELGDKGHDRWFLEDAARLNVSLDLDVLFSEAHEPSRDTSYALVAQVLGASNDYSRLAVMLSLEAAAHEFFVRVPGFAARAGVEAELKYFGIRHLEAEESHEIFTEDVQTRLALIEIPLELRNVVAGTVYSTFAAMTNLGDALEAAMLQSGSSRT